MLIVDEATVGMMPKLAIWPNSSDLHPTEYAIRGHSFDSVDRLKQEIMPEYHTLSLQFIDHSSSYEWRRRLQCAMADTLNRF